MQPTESAWISELAKNGPWAAMAGLLLFYVLRGWTEDRKQVTALLGEFRTSIDSLTREIHQLGEIQKTIQERSK